MRPDNSERPVTETFFAFHRHGFVRAAACTPAVLPGDPGFNAAATLALARQGHARGVDLMLFPELGLSAYAIDDLLLQDALLRRVEAELAGLAAASRDLSPVLVVGAPLAHNGRLYNCAVAISLGERTRACLSETAKRTPPFDEDEVNESPG